MDVEEFLFDLFFLDLLLVVEDHFEEGGVLFREVLVSFLVELSREVSFMGELRFGEKGLVIRIHVQERASCLLRDVFEQINFEFT